MHLCAVSTEAYVEGVQPFLDCWLSVVKETLKFCDDLLKAISKGTHKEFISAYIVDKDKAKWNAKTISEMVVWSHLHTTHTAMLRRKSKKIMIA